MRALTRPSASTTARLALMGLCAAAALPAGAADAPKKGPHHFHLRKNATPVRSAASQPAGGSLVTSTVPLTANATEGAFTLQDEVWDPAFSVPLHFHKRHAEVFYVLEGEAEWTADGETRAMTAGDLLYLPPNTPHTVRVRGGKPLRTLFLYTPGGYEDQGDLSRRFSKEDLATPVARAFAEVLGDFNPLPNDTIFPGASGKGPHHGRHRFGLGSTARVAHNPSGNVTSKILVSGDESEGRFTIQDESWPADFNVRLHHHKRHWEVFYLVSGSIEWTVGGETHEMQAGDLVYVPANTPHKVHVTGGKAANILFIYGPGGYEATVDLPNTYTQKAFDENPAAKAALAELEDFNVMEDPNPYKPR